MGLLCCAVLLKAGLSGVKQCEGLGESPTFLPNAVMIEFLGTILTQELYLPEQNAIDNDEELKAAIIAIIEAKLRRFIGHEGDNSSALGVSEGSRFVGAGRAMMDLAYPVLGSSTYDRARSSPAFLDLVLSSVDLMLELEPPTEPDDDICSRYQPLRGAMLVLCTCSGLIFCMGLDSQTPSRRYAPIGAPHLVLRCLRRAVAVTIKTLEKAQDPALLASMMGDLEVMVLASLVGSDRGDVDLGNGRRGFHFAAHALDYSEPGLLVEALTTARSMVSLAALLPETLDLEDAEEARKPSLLLESIIKAFTFMWQPAKRLDVATVAAEGLEALDAAVMLLEQLSKAAMWLATSPAAPSAGAAFQHLRGKVFNLAIRICDNVYVTDMASTISPNKDGSVPGMPQTLMASLAMANTTLPHATKRLSEIFF